MTNPHPWDNDVDSRTGSGIAIANNEGRSGTVITINQTSSQSGSDTSIKDTDSDSSSSDAWDISSLLSPDNTSRPAPQLSQPHIPAGATIPVRVRINERERFRSSSREPSWRKPSTPKIVCNFYEYSISLSGHIRGFSHLLKYLRSSETLKLLPSSKILLEQVILTP